MKWLRLRKTWSYGVDRWKYVPLFTTKADESNVKERYIEPIIEDMSWSEKFRGVEYNIVSTKSVPNKHIQSEYEDSKTHIEYLKEEVITEAKNLLALQELQGKGRKTDPDDILRAKRDKRDKKLLKEARERMASAIKANLA